MKSNYDIHLSAQKITPETITKLEKLGFVRDEFANNTRCIASEYHATFRGPQPLPDDLLWENISSILKNDKNFYGCLEEESISSDRVKLIDGKNSATIGPYSPIPIHDVPAGQHKACDLHIGINLNNSTLNSIEFLEKLEIASFDKPIPEGIRRVYTITCDTLESGENLFDVLFEILSKLDGLQGKMKLEKTTRYVRIPEDAPTLPLTSSPEVSSWIKKVEQ